MGTQALQIAPAHQVSELRLPGARQSHAEIHPYALSVGVELQSPNVEAHGVLVQPLVGISDPHVGPRPGVVGLEVQRLLVGLNGLRAAAGVGLGGPELVPQRVVLGPKRQRVPEGVHRPAEVLAEGAEHAQGHGHVRIVRRQGLGAPEHLYRRPDVKGRALAGQGAVPRVALQPFLQVGHGLWRLQLVGVAHPQGEEHVAVRGVGRVGPVHGGDGLHVVVVLRMDEAQVVPRVGVLGVPLGLGLERQHRLREQALLEQHLAFCHGVGVGVERVVLREPVGLAACRPDSGAVELWVLL
mmetsp:Transcript_28266/g.79048  ORF Transcript_28266/g.79048 Transcript_28266/m.79048 type:complete len:297 (-) Transcript_28266:336-1226(-)